MQAVFSSFQSILLCVVWLSGCIWFCSSNDLQRSSMPEWLSALSLSCNRPKELFAIQGLPPNLIHLPVPGIKVVSRMHEIQCDFIRIFTNNAQSSTMLELIMYTQYLINDKGFYFRVLSKHRFVFLWHNSVCLKNKDVSDITLCLKIHWFIDFV